MLKKGDPRIDSLLVVSASAFIPLLLVPGNTAGCIIMTFPRIIEAVLQMSHAADLNTKSTNI